MWSIVHDTGYKFAAKFVTLLLPSPLPAQDLEMEASTAPIVAECSGILLFLYADKFSIASVFLVSK